MVVRTPRIKYDGSRDFLTFVDAKVIARVNAGLFDHFDDGKYLLLFGQTARAKERLDYFKNSLDEAINARGESYQTVALQQLQKEYDRLSYVTADDALEPAKSTVSNYLLSKLSNNESDFWLKFLIVRGTMNDVYDLAENGSSSARQALENYFAKLTALLGQDKTHAERLRNLLVEENQIMDNLFQQYPLFYRDHFFAIKGQLEQQLLAQLPQGEAKNDEKQTIVSNKIDFLRQLKTFFLADKISLEDAKQIVFRLFREADDLQLPADQQVAVSELYAQRLKDFGVFYRYLNSSEYVSTTLHGSSRKNQFDQFVQAQQEQVSIDQVRQEILSGQATPATPVTPAIPSADQAVVVATPTVETPAPIVPVAPAKVRRSNNASI